MSCPKVAVNIFLILALSTCLCSADELRWKFSPGDKYEVKINQKTVLKSTVNRTNIDVELELGAEMSWEVESIKENGNAVLNQTYTRMNVRVAKTAKPTIKFDTSKPDDKEGDAKHFAEVYNQLVNMPFQVEMTNRGEIVDVILSKDDVETLRSIPESMEARQLFEKRGLMKLVNSGGFVLPEGDIKTGFQWPVKKQQKMSFGTADFESIFTYKGKNSDSGIATFSVQATAKLKDQPKNPLEKPLTLKSQQQQGKVEFNVTDGYLKSVVNKQDMATEKPFREMTIETTSVIENRLSVVKK